MATHPYQSTFPNTHGPGLTKREFFAILILALDQINSSGPKEVLAVEMADRLIKALNDGESQGGSGASGGGRV